MLDQVKRWEESELKDQSDRPPAYLTAPLKRTSGKLAPINNFADPGSTPVQLLHNQIAGLTEENNQLKEKVRLLEQKALDIIKEKQTTSKQQVPAPPVIHDDKGSEVEELTAAFKQVKLKMADELEANSKEKMVLETDLVSTKHQLLEVQHNLTLAEKVV